MEVKKPAWLDDFCYTLGAPEEIIWPGLQEFMSAKPDFFRRQYKYEIFKAHEFVPKPNFPQIKFKDLWWLWDMMYQCGHKKAELNTQQVEDRLPHGVTILSSFSHSVKFASFMVSAFTLGYSIRVTQFDPLPDPSEVQESLPDDLQVFLEDTYRRGLLRLREIVDMPVDDGKGGISSSLLSVKIRAVKELKVMIDSGIGLSLGKNRQETYDEGGDDELAELAELERRARVRA